MRPQFGNLRQSEPAERRCSHLIRIGLRFIVIYVGHQLIEQFASAVNACTEFSRELTGKKLFHQLVKDDAAAGAGTDHLEMLNVAFRSYDALERVAESIGIMFAGPAPHYRRRAFPDDRCSAAKISEDCSLVRDAGAGISRRAKDVRSSSGMSS